MGTEDFAGMTLDELDSVAQSVVTCLEVDPADSACLAEAYRLARGVLDLIDEHRFLAERLPLISGQLDLVSRERDQLKARLELLRKAAASGKGGES